MAYRQIFRFPRPRTFLYLMSLRTGTSLILLTLLTNKISGVYGILALLTGLTLSPLQLSMYIYSIIALLLTSFFAGSVRDGSPLHALSLSWFYLIDSIINAAYTAAFGIAWFVVLAKHTDAKLGGGGEGGYDRIPGGSTIDETAGFSDPAYNVSSVAITTSGKLVGEGAGSSSTSNTNAPVLWQSGSMASISVISFLWIIRVYFILILFAYARGVLRQHIVTSCTSASNLAVPAPDGSQLAEDPFAEGKELGMGWRGRLGRAMVMWGRAYWLGPDEEGEIVRDFVGAGHRGSGKGLFEGTGVGERERRRRAGTGPSKTSPPFMKPVELGALRKK